MLESKVDGRIATVRMLAPQADESSPLIDLLFSASGIEQEVVEEAEELKFGRAQLIKVAKVPHLLAMKVLAADEERRPRDYEDISQLLRVASKEDVRRVSELLELIKRRGRARDKDLEELFQRLLVKYARDLSPKPRAKK